MISMWSRHLCFGSEGGSLDLLTVLVVLDFIGLGHELWNDIVLVSFSIAVVRHHDQDNLQKKSLFWTYNFRCLEFITILMVRSLEMGRQIWNSNSS